MDLPEVIHIIDNRPIYTEEQVNEYHAWIEDFKKKYKSWPAAIDCFFYNKTIWHKFPDELPEDYSAVITAAYSKTGERIIHFFQFSDKDTVKMLIDKKKNTSYAFLDWSISRHFDIAEWTYIE